MVLLVAVAAVAVVVMAPPLVQAVRQSIQIVLLLRVLHHVFHRCPSAAECLPIIWASNHRTILVRFDIYAMKDPPQIHFGQFAQYLLVDTEVELDGAEFDVHPAYIWLRLFYLCNYY